MRKRPLNHMVITIAALILVVGGCGGAAAPTPSSSRDGSTAAAAPTYAAAAATRAPAAAAATPAQVAQAQAPGSNHPSDAAALAAVGKRMVIYTSNISLLVKDTQATIDSVTRIAANLGGYVVSSDSHWESDQQLATMTIRVLAEQHDNAMASLRGLGIKVLDEKSSTQDVGEEYADQGAALRNWEAIEAQYVDFLSKAANIDEVLKVQDKIGEARGQIEKIKGRMTYLDDQTALATISVSIKPEVEEKVVAKVEPTATPQPVWDPGGHATRAWDRSVGFLQGVANVVIYAAAFFWWVIPFAAVGLWAWRRYGRPIRRPIPVVATVPGDTPGGPAPG